MNQSNIGKSSFLAELAGEATQKLEAQRVQQQDQQAMEQSVNAALDRTFQFFNLFTKHLNALEPDLQRVFVLDGNTHFSKLKWKRGIVDCRKQSLADNALLDHVFLQIKLTVPEPVTLNRRWEKFDETKRELYAFGLKPKEDLDELWRSRPQKDTFQIQLEPEFLVRSYFQGNYVDGNIDISCNNFESFGAMKAKLSPELMQANLFDDIGRFLMGRTHSLPRELKLSRDFSKEM